MELAPLEDTNSTNKIKNKEDNKRIGQNSLQEIDDYLQYPEVQSWLKTVSSGTANSYLKTIKEFCSWCGKDPHQLIMGRDLERNISEPLKRIATKNLILDFRKYLERKSCAPKTINQMDGAVRSFFSAILGKAGMINIGNYPDRDVTIRKDLVPTLEEVKRMIDVSDISVKFSIIFLAQTGMRPEDALKLTVGDVKREFDLRRCPLAISFLPEKDRNKNIGERITFLGKDGIDILKQYLDWRKRNSETLTEDSPLFVGRSKKFNGKSTSALKKLMLHKRIQEAAKKSGIGNGNGKYGTMRAYCLRKFFITQLTNHGVEDKIINFFTCHKLSPVDIVYWSRRVEDLREIYRQREKYLNPISGIQSTPSPEEINQKIHDKIREFVQSQEFQEIIRTTLNYKNSESYNSKIVSTEEEILRFTDDGYDCTPIGSSKWLMRKRFCQGVVNC